MIVRYSLAVVRRLDALIPCLETLSVKVEIAGKKLGNDTLRTRHE